MIILTGGAGFIGSCVLRYLNDQGITDVVVVDNLGTTEKWENLVGKQFLDLIHKDQLFDWLKGRESEVQAFVHLGACSSTVEADANYLLENNYRYTLRLAEYALKNQIRFIYASSAATYGDGSQGFSDDHDGLETLKPLNMYGYSKHLFDLWAKRQGVLDNVVGLKYFNVFGPNEWHKGRMCSAVVKMVPVVLQEGVVRLFRSSEPDRFADGGQMRDFVYAKDVARMTCDFLNNDAAGIYNIGMGIPNTWNDLAKAVFASLNLPERIEYIEMPKDLIGKYQNYTHAEMSKAQKVLGGSADCQPLHDAVIDYVRKHILPEEIW